jgi:hypothetical protein
VLSDFYPEFEMRMAHARFLPDEATAAQAPRYPLSGLLGEPAAFADNVLGRCPPPAGALHLRERHRERTRARAGLVSGWSFAAR